MATRRYLLYDVFTRTGLAGNPLAIVLDGEGLDTERMQAIAAEFNLSETVFVTPPENSIHTARIRIFTPRQELPFAGHPTVGTAVALSDRVSEIGQAERTSIIVLEENVGPVRCAVSTANGAAFAEFDLPRTPEPFALDVPAEVVAAALGLAHHEIGFENHAISGWTAGVPYICVPVANLEAAGRARLDAGLWEELAPRIGAVLSDAYVYCRETVNHDCAFHARMFAPGAGIPEDPATGSAAAAFAGAVLMYDEPVDGAHRYWIEQGVEMGRPSRIRLEIDVAGGAIEAARIGGGAVKVAEGRLFV
ncbi:PhzF family phenazine biosynthesis protein [Chelativorans sp. M5D2P16]|uniref:PhzF family phenazine biosynthesis protein n=1 Tax=Chelativorans sp. M5D2P16 TaxID=3095678 RepID=UPI002ACA9B42|nr:PhzF family phenazine biosynthesis protein [Chelativorans sp. M5D2P16]MDZ5696834.1 PhzF family phenazine biosynthesis protein [Chelativorans sp. M5D2P16]